ncbi:hypothetical protein DL771_001249 [Monosporascus sp. 5C6A]|nr:hypothetical protein DL771_001249 [Monosporascus sp. 5C6A]
MEGQVLRDEIYDNDLSIRFKHGNHTIFLFVDPLKPFSDAAGELLEILKERYPDGLTTSAIPPKKTALPSDASRIEFAVPKDKLDPSKGWKPLKIVLGEDTPASKDIKDNSMIAFAIQPEDGDGDKEVAFEVDFPGYEDDYPEDAE